MRSRSIGTLLNTTYVVIILMTLDMKSPVKKVSSAKTSHMKMAVRPQFASQQILVKNTLPLWLVRTVDTQIISVTGSNVQKVSPVNSKIQHHPLAAITSV